MGDQNWRTGITSADFFGQQKKALAVADRRPVIRKPSDLVGPGIAATAVRLTDFNDLLATYDGFFSADSDVSNGPPGGEGFIGLVSSDSALGGLQLFTGLVTETTYQRVFRRNPSDAATIYWGDWVALGTSSGGGGTGLVETIVEGDHITVDDTDPANPIVAAVGFLETETLPESIIDAKGDLIVGTAADTAARLAVGANGRVLVADSSQASGLIWSERRRQITYTIPGAVAVGAGTLRLYNDSGVDWTINSVRATLGTVASSGSTTVDVNNNGVSIFGTAPTITAGNQTNKTTTISDPTVPDGEYLTVDVDAAGTGAADLMVTITIH